MPLLMIPGIDEYLCDFDMGIDPQYGPLPENWSTTPDPQEAHMFSLKEAEWYGDVMGWEIVTWSQILKKKGREF